MKKKEIQSMGEKELKTKLKELYVQLIKERIKPRGESLKIKSIKKTIARINTQLNKLKHGNLS